MPPTTTEKGYTIGIKQTGGTAAQSHFAIFNSRTREVKRVQTSSNEAQVNLNNEKDFPSGYNNGDLIQITGSGLKGGHTTHTVDRSKGGATVTVTMTDASTTNAPAVSIG